MLQSSLRDKQIMARTVINDESPAVVAQRMSDLLQCFPAAVMGGVQWKTLVRKYEQCHSTRLDIAALGFCSALAAVTALLFDVLRIVDSEDTDNPIIAIEDSIALLPNPGSAASWPSLYRVLCSVVRDHGLLEDGERIILVSQLKPLLQRHWHNTFDEGSLSYLTEEGSAVKLRKMKHLLQAVLRWRQQCCEQRRGAAAEAACASLSKAGGGGQHSGLGALDKALSDELELVPSKRHNDLLLRFVVSSVQSSAPASAAAQPEQQVLCKEVASAAVGTSCGSLAWAGLLEEPRASSWADESDKDPDTASTVSTVPSSVPPAMQDEIALLRAENARLRHKNSLLEAAKARDEQASVWLPEAVGLDDPFEPPPQALWCPTSPACSSTRRGSFGSSSLDGTPLTSTSCQQSGACTPVHLVPYTFAPVVGWFAKGDRGEIPSGLVQQARAVFERHTAIPNWFSQQ
eukprot:TRINITY_DN104594_c0_g1_i1.p1 TRINITY_DN104594_c0_g1~~TRINITY_DN104594_c0_g1_i1.p1  ORF type:complete len:460 (+),score=97.30 TRINITY_DN104594_c0_g1_i1:114-1493(+)